MAIKPIIKRLIKPIPLLISASVLVITLCFLIANSLQSDTSGEFQYWVIIATIAGIALLVGLILINLVILYRQYRKQILGSRLSLRLVGMFILLNFLPLLLVYYFAVQFLNKGVDTWFDVKVEQAVNDALLLGQTSLETIKQDMVSEMQEHSKNIAETLSSPALISALNDIRSRSGYSEMSVLTKNGRIIANSSIDGNNLVPDLPEERALSQVALGQSYSSVVREITI